jgi:hypothetical protein
MNELVLGGLLLGEPVDPLGYTYVLSEAGKAEISAESPLKKKAAKTPGSK